MRMWRVHTILDKVAVIKHTTQHTAHKTTQKWLVIYNRI